MSHEYLPSVNGGLWAISRVVNGNTVSLVQDRPLEVIEDAFAVLSALRMLAFDENLNYYFPLNEYGQRCPTRELLELCNTLDPTNPFAIGDHSRQIGV